MNQLWYFIKRILFYFYNFSGLRHIWENIIFPLDKQTGKWKPSTFIIWIIGIYVALFGIASQRYENRVDIIENRMNAIFTQLGTSLYKNALSRIPETQRLPCPLKPDIKKPLTVYQSLFKDTFYIEGVDLLKATIENWKSSLSGIDLSYAILDSVDLSESNLEAADLTGANLSGATLVRGNLREVIFSGANLSGATLFGSDLTNSRFQVVDLRHANLTHVDFERAEFLNSLLDSADFATMRELDKNLLSSSFYSRHAPINLPDGMVLPTEVDYEQWCSLLIVHGLLPK